jgi:CheY-like chemotaxis protein
MLGAGTLPFWPTCGATSTTACGWFSRRRERYRARVTGDIQLKFIDPAVYCVAGLVGTLWLIAVRFEREGTSAMREAARVFVVDDEPTIRETLAAILYNEGYKAIPFEDGAMALSAAAEESPDLLITDVMMPDMNGVDLAIHFNDLYPECEVLLFSASVAAGDLLASARLRGYDFELWAKPMQPVKLLERLQAL